MAERHILYCYECSYCRTPKNRCGFTPALGLLAVAISFAAISLACADDSYRPQFHITPPSGWTNDNCGMYYADGQYHLHYLWDSNAVGWGKSWAHVVSSDLVHWTPLPISIANDSALGEAWSGSGLVDTHNTAGFQTGTNKVQVLAFTSNTSSAGQNVGISYSNDNGMTWTRYANNPVVAHPNDGNTAFRDPKVFWNEAKSNWGLVLSRGYSAPGNMYQSANLKDWTPVGNMPAGECPDIFELPVENKTEVKKWVYVAGSYNPSAPNNGVGANYFIGDFDGASFTSASSANTLGGNFFVGQSFNQVPSADGRRIYMGWKWLPSEKYGSLGDWAGGVQSLPVALTLRDVPDVGVRMCYDPVKELESMRGEHFSFGPQTIAAGNSLLSSQGVEGELLEVIAKFQVGTATAFGLQLRKGADGACTVGYDTVTQTLSFTPSVGTNAISQSLAPEDGLITLHIFLDRSVIDIFGNDGLTWNTEFFKASPASLGLELFATGGTVQLQSLDVWKLTTVPEPPMSVLGGASVLVVAGYSWRKRTGASGGGRLGRQLLHGQDERSAVERQHALYFTRPSGTRQPVRSRGDTGLAIGVSEPSVFALLATALAGLLADAWRGGNRRRSDRPRQEPVGNCDRRLAHDTTVRIVA